MKLSDYRKAKGLSDYPPQEVQDTQVSEEEMQKFHDPRMLEDIPNGNDTSGHLDMFISEVRSNMAEYLQEVRKEIIESQQRLTSMDQDLFSIAQNMLAELDASVTIDKIEQVFSSAMARLRNNGSAYSNKMRALIQNLDNAFENSFKPQNQTYGKPQLASLVRAAFKPRGADYGGGSELTQSMPINNPGGGAGALFNSTTEDTNTRLDINQSPPGVTDKSPSMDKKNTLVQNSQQIYENVKIARDAAYQLYRDALNFTGVDVEVKSDLVNSANKMARKLDALLEIIQSTHFNINRINTK